MFRAFLAIIGSFTLIVGGIGVSNIMYVVVEERTREIGVKLAVGAKPSFILSQFLVETLTLTAIGGALGFLITLGRDGRLPGLPRRVRGHAGGLADRDPATTTVLLGVDRPRGRLLPGAARLAARPRGRPEALVRLPGRGCEPSSPWSGGCSGTTPRARPKRIALTVLAIAWGTLSIVLLLSFGEGLKRAFHKGKNGMGEGIGILWPGATTRAYAGPALGPHHLVHRRGRRASCAGASRDRGAVPRVRACAAA